MANTEGIGVRDESAGGRREEGSFAQHRITGRHVIGRRPSRLVGTDELLSARRNREVGGERSRSGSAADSEGERRGERERESAGGRLREVW